MTYPYRSYLITDRQSLNGLSLEEVVNYATDAGVTCVQLREKHTSTREFIQLGKSLHCMLQRKKIPLFINDRVDVALAVNAEGIHVGADDMDYNDIFNILAPTMKIGMTIDYPQQIVKLNKLNLAYLGVSSLFESQVKKDIKHLWSAKELMYLRKMSQHQLVAIGGINEGNIDKIPAKCVDGFAISSAICNQPTGETLITKTRQLLNKINEYHDVL
jgi:thiamine-phosphate diphosphorylase